MSNYNKEIFRQIEELTVENEELKKEKQAIKLENRELRQRLVALENSIEDIVARAVEKATAPLYKRIEELEAENEQKDKEILRLKAQINKDSSNSSKPPSSNGLKKIPNSREKSNKKVGGQRGHKGVTLTVPKNLDELVKEGKAKRKVVDHTNGLEKYISQWEIDVEIIINYTEHRYPIGVMPKVYYGEGVKVLSVLLSNEGIVAEGRLSDFFESISNGMLTVSDGTIEKFNCEAAEKVDIEKLKQDLLNGKLMHTDETIMKSTQLLEYDEEVPKTAEKTTFDTIIRTHSNETTTLYTVNPHKGDEGVRRDGIIPAFVGILSHDHDVKYYKYGKLHATCGAHLLRELKGLFDLYKIDWADQFRQFYRGINDYKNATEKCSKEKLLEFERKYDEFLDKGDSFLSSMPEKGFGRAELSPILKRLRKYKDNYLLFIRDYTAPFTNNQAERDLRPCKTKQKVSGCFRSWKGLVCYAKIRSFISTAKKRSQNLFAALRDLFLNKNMIPA